MKLTIKVDCSDCGYEDYLYQDEPEAIWISCNCEENKIEEDEEE